MDAAVQGSTGGKRFAMKAQRPVRDTAMLGDSVVGEEYQGMSMGSAASGSITLTLRLIDSMSRWTAAELLSNRSGEETKSPGTSPRMRNHAIPSTIHEDAKEETDARSASLSDSPRFDHNVQATITNSTVRGHGHRGASPSHTEKPIPPNPAIPEKQYPSPPLPTHLARPLNLNKENRDPYNGTSDGQMERMTTDSKIWSHGKPPWEKPQSPPMQVRHLSGQPSHGLDRPAVTLATGSVERDMGSHAPPPTSYQQYQGMPSSGDLPLITPTTARSMTSTERGMDDPPPPHQMPPFVAYNTYQQAMTPVANGYQHMQMQQQAPPTVSQLPAGRKAFTVSDEFHSPTIRKLTQQRNIGQ